MSCATHVQNGVSVRELERILIKVAQTTERAMPNSIARESYSVHDTIYDQGNRKGVVCPWEREEELVLAAATATRSAIDVCLDAADSYTANRLAPFPRTNCWRKVPCPDIPGDWGKRTDGGAATDTFGNCTGSSFDKFSYNKSNRGDNKSISNHRGNAVCGDVNKVNKSIHDQDPTSPHLEKEICGIKNGLIMEDLDDSSKTNSDLDSCNTPKCSNIRQKPFCLLEELFENGLRFIRSWKEEMAKQLHETANDESPPLPAHKSSQKSESKVRKRQRDQLCATSRSFRHLLKEGLNFIRKWKDEMAMQFPDNFNDVQSPEIDWSLYSQLWEEGSELLASSHAGTIANASVVPLRSKIRQRPCILRHKNESDSKKSSEYASEYGGEPELMSEHDNEGGGEIDLSESDSELGITSDDDSGNGDEAENGFKNDSKNGRRSEHKCEGDGEKYIDDENGCRYNDNRNSLGTLSSCECGNENDSNVESSNEDVNDSDDVNISEDDNYSGDENGSEYYNDNEIGDENSIEDNDSDDEHSSENDSDHDSSDENSIENDNDNDSDDENSSEHDNNSGNENSSEHDDDSGDENSSEHDNDSGDENSSEQDNDSGDESSSEHDNDSGDENSSEHDDDSGDENSSEHDNDSGDENSSEHDDDSGDENSSEHDNDSGDENSSEHDNDSGDENSSEHDNDSGDENSSEHDNDSGNENSNEHNNDSGNENSSEHDNDSGDENSSENDSGDENSSKHDNDSGVENNSEHDNDNDSGDENNSEHGNDSSDENSSDDHSDNENRCKNDSDDEQISKNINGNYVSCSNDNGNCSESQNVVGGPAGKRPKLHSKEKNSHPETIYSVANSFENAHLVFPKRKEELGTSYEHINKRPQNKNATSLPDWDNSCVPLLKLVLINNMRRRVVSFSQTNGTASSPPAAPTNTVD